MSSRADPEITVMSNHAQLNSHLPSSGTKGEWKIVLTECTILVDESFWVEFKRLRVRLLVVSQAPVKVVRNLTTHVQS